jgi:hypothetical protein
MDIAIEGFLADEGFLDEAAARARAILEAAGLTRVGKRRIAVNKLNAARTVLQSRLLRICHRAACRQPEDARERVVVLPRACQVCGGSTNRRAGELARQALLDAGYRRILVVGGTRTTHADLRGSLADGDLEVRCVDGSQSTRPLPTVEADLDWADVLVIWATTPLPHKLSLRYTSRAPGRLPCITVARRGVAALCNELKRLSTPNARRTAAST